MIIKPKAINLSDEELVQAIVKEKDTLLFEVLYDRYERVVFNKCYGFANGVEEAKDMTQDVFLKLFIKLASFKGRSKFSSWLYAFTYNHCVNYVQRNTAKKIERNAVSADIIENIGDKPVDINIEDMKVEKLKMAINKIPPDDKMILLLKHEDGLSIKDIADALDLGESAVKMRLKRAKEKLVLTYSKKDTDG